MCDACFIEAWKARLLTTTDKETMFKKYTSQLMMISNLIRLAASNGVNLVYIKANEIDEVIDNLPDYNGFINFIKEMGYDIKVTFGDGKPKLFTIGW